MSDSLVALVRSSKAGDQRAFADLLERLKPLLRVLARKFGPVGHEDDALQEAAIRIWQQIHEVKLSQIKSIQYYLVNAGVFAIRTLNRRVQRQNRSFVGLPANQEVAVNPPPDSCLPELPPTVALYFQFIVEHGTVLGAHVAVGRKLGVVKSSAFRRFHQEAKTLMEKL